MNNSDLIQKMTSDYDCKTVDRKISPKDTMKGESYFSVGESAVEIIKVACACSFIKTVNHILDLPCGYGRILRHLVKLFPKSGFDACDLDTDGVNFCASRFGANPVYSKEDLTKVTFPNSYDIIWIGSLFTHTDLNITAKWIAHISNFLSQDGIIIATFHGRWCQYVHRYYPYIREDAWQKILMDYSQKGSGYHDYDDSENHPFIKGSYGVSLLKPHVTINLLEDIPNIRIYLYMERGWADHQDVAVFGRPPFNKLWPGME